MKQTSRANCKDLTLALLKIVAAGCVTGLIYSLGDARRGQKASRMLAEFSKAQISQALKLIKLRKLVKPGPNQKEPIVLTEKGFRKMCLWEKDQEIRRFAAWDMLWRVIVFDISNNLKRDGFRRDLIKLGWYKLQHSVYVNPEGKLEPAKNCIAYYGLKRRCVIFTAADLGPFEKSLRKHFFGPKF